MIRMLNQSTGLMRLTKTKGFLLSSLIAGAMVVPFLIPVQKVQADNEESGQVGNLDALLGTWITQVSIDPNSVPPGSHLNFTTVSTYGAGGGLVVGQMGNGPGPLPGAGGGPDGHGNWARAGGRHYATTFSASAFDANGLYALETKVRESLTLNKRGDEITGSSQVDLILPDGTVLPFHPAGTYVGHRMPIEPLN